MVSVGSLEGVIPGAHEVIGRGLRRGVRAVGGVGRGLREGGVVLAKRTVHLVGGNVEEAKALRVGFGERWP